jgi:hypothetical protein
MALIVITVSDNAKGECDVGVLAEPGIDTSQPETMLTPAQVTALNMLHAIQGDIKRDRGLIALIN